MGRLIDAIRAKEILYESEERITNNISDKIASFIRENYIHKADYENRLKSDMVAMLTGIQLEIEEVKTQSGFDEAWDGAVKQCSEIIQQKIDKLKEVKDGENNN